MTRRITLGQIGGYSEQKFEQLLRATVFETDKRLKEESPVDTGRFRLSWAVSESGTPGYDPGPQSAPPAINAPLKLDYQTEKLGGVYHIHNNLPYAEPLAIGHSPQAPAGWTERIAREMTNWVQSEATRIARQD